MKNSILFITGLVALLITGCKEMDDVYKQYVVPGGITYPQKPTNLLIWSGDGRVKVEWDRIVDPHVEMCVVYWNNYADSVIVDLQSQHTDVSFFIDGLEEKDYTFIVRTLDAKGNRSRDEEWNTHVYGDEYRASLYNRIVEDIYSVGLQRYISFMALDESSEAEYTTISYYDTDGREVETVINADETLSPMGEYDPDKGISYTTYYRPDSLCVDLFAAPESREILYYRIPKYDWIASADSYEPTGQMPLGGPPSFAIDDDMETYWFTEHVFQLPDFPHWFAVDMGRPVEVHWLEITRFFFNNHTGFNRFMIQGSNDGIGWEDIKEFDAIHEDGPQKYDLSDMVPVYSHLRMYIAEGVYPWGYIMEFSVYGKYTD